MPTISLSLGERSYDVHVSNGALDSVGYLCARQRMQGKAAVITDSQVCPLYASRVLASLEDAGLTSSLHVFEAGEQSKNLHTVETLVSEMVAEGHDRSSFVVALGGGVVGDMAGFIASIYYRGIPFVQVPTTVMAQVDSSVGGKTAVDLPSGKNLVGSFCQPRFVVADPITLTSLPPRVMCEGMAEMVKHALLDSGEHVEEVLAADLADVAGAGFLGLIEQSVAVKARFVRQDPKEEGWRRALNLGHTAGHAIESAALQRGEAVTHGEAVAHGLVAALWLSVRKRGFDAGLYGRVREFVRRTYPRCEAAAEGETLYALMLHDKKNERAGVNFTLLRAPGEPEINCYCEREEILEALKEIG